MFIKIFNNIALQTKSKYLHAWWRALKINRITANFQLIWLKKQAFNSFKKYYHYRFIKESLVENWIHHRNKTIMKKFYITWKMNAKELVYMRHIKIHKVGKMYLFKKKQVLYAWRKWINDMKYTKLMILKADKLRISTLFKSFRKGWIKSKQEEIAFQKQK